MKNKIIKIKYVDFWRKFIPEHDTIYLLLKQNGFDVELSEQPDYLICGVFGKDALQEHYDECIKIFFTGENICPDFNLYDYAVGCDYINFGERYFRFPHYYDVQYEKTWEMLSQKHLNTKDTLRRKTDFCSFVYSNSNGNPIRKQFFCELSKYKRIDSGGRYLNNIGTTGVPDKIEFESKHKFSIAFENTSHPGYITEKLIQAFAASTIPIYWGDTTVSSVFNPKSFICVHDFETLADVINRIKIVDENDDLFLQYLNTPALLNSTKFNRAEQVTCLLNFLNNIFSQPKEKAFRRNREFWGEIYISEIRRLIKSCEEQTTVEKFIRIARTEGWAGIQSRIKDKLRRN